MVNSCNHLEQRPADVEKLISLPSDASDLVRAFFVGLGGGLLIKHRQPFVGLLQKSLADAQTISVFLMRIMYIVTKRIAKASADLALAIRSEHP